MRTYAEIEQEIAALRTLKTKVKQFSFFGDDHHKAIDAAINVLTCRMDHTQVDALYEDEPYVWEVAGSACDWMHGEVEEAVSADGWPHSLEGV